PDRRRRQIERNLILPAGADRISRRERRPDLPRGNRAAAVANASGRVPYLPPVLAVQDDLPLALWQPLLVPRFLDQLGDGIRRRRLLHPRRALALLVRPGLEHL